ncbi:MAG: hypothetical protein ACRDJN_07035 [Chloroflexota bacterium]
MAKPAADRNISPDAPRTITLRWGAILGGLAVAYIASVAFGVLLARVGQAGNLSVVPLVQFVALFAGGYVAGRWAGVSGFMNGVVVAVAFIAVWAVQNGILEARLVHEYGPLALPRMNMGGIILGDLLNLSAAALGGWLAERKRA